MSGDKEKRTFTPGPWRLSANIHEKEHGEQEYFHITARVKHSDIGMIKVAKYDPMRSIDTGNARLIAAAPELHAQAKILERLLTELSMQGETGTDEALEEVRAVLAKVDGGEG